MNDKENSKNDFEEWKVDGNHPIGARPDKTFHGATAECDAKKYADELRLLGFENVNINMISKNMKKENIKISLDDNKNISITLRTWLAGQALCGLASNMTLRDYEHDFAKIAVKLADFTLEELRKNENNFFM